MDVFAMAYAPDTAYQFYRLGYMQARERPSDTVSLTVLFARTASLKPNILIDDLMTLDTVAGRFYDVLPRNQSPYAEHRVVAFAPHKSIAPGLSFVLTLPRHSLASNAPNATYEIDAADGLGFRAILPDSSLNVTYAHDGRYAWTLRITESGQSYLAHSYINVKPPQRPALLNGGRFCEVIDWVGGTITIAFAQNPGNCVDRVIRNPLIIVDPFDPFNDTEIDEVFNRVDRFGQFGAGPFAGERLQDIINDRNIDIIYINYPDGGADLFTNGQYVSTALTVINARLASDGVIIRPNLVGLSMGGLTSIIAINLLEDPNRDGIVDEDSGIGRLFTFDSPLRGANVPINLQIAAQIAIATEIRGSFFINPRTGEPFRFDFSALEAQPDLQVADAALNSPAAYDMLYRHAFTEGGGHISPDRIGYTSAAHEAFYERFRAINITVPIYAMSDGNAAITQDIVGPGSLATVLPNGLMLGLDRQTRDGLQIRLRVDYLPEGFFFRIRQTIQYDLPLGYRIRYSIPLLEIDIEHPDVPNYDVAPGGTETLGLDQFIVAATNGLDFNVEASVGSSYFCFVPTRSALDLDFEPGISDILGSPIVGSRADFTVTTDNEVRAQDPALIARNADGAIVAPFPTEVFNHRHVTFTNAIGTFFVENALPLPGPPQTMAGVALILNTRYNFGSAATTTTGQPQETPRLLTGRRTLSSGAAYYVNRAGRVGDFDNANNPTNDLNAFDVLLTTADCQGTADITLQSGAEFLVGEADRTATVTALLGTRVTVQDGGVLAVDRGSDFILRSAGPDGAGGIVVEAGGLINAVGPFWSPDGGGRIVADNGGVIRVKAGGQIRASSAGQLVAQNGGRIILEDGALVQLWDGNNPNSDGVIWIRQGGTLEILGSYTFTGSGYFHLDNGANVDGPGALHISRGDVVTSVPNKSLRRLVLGSHADIHLDQGQDLQVEQCLVEANHGQLWVSNGGVVKVDDVGWHNGNYAIRTDALGEVLISNAKFLGGSGPMIVCPNRALMAPVNITHSNFVDIENFAIIIEGSNSLDDGPNKPIVESCTFSQGFSGVNFIFFKNGRIVDCTFDGMSSDAIYLLGRQKH